MAQSNPGDEWRDLAAATENHSGGIAAIVDLATRLLSTLPPSHATNVRMELSVVNDVVRHDLRQLAAAMRRAAGHAGKLVYPFPQRGEQ